MAAGRPPLYGSFFGDFGSGLNEKNGLFAVLPQLPGNLSSGFAVRLGCGGGPAPTLVLGLTEAVRGAVTSWVPLQEDPLSPPFPNSDRPTYAHAQLAAAFALQRGEITYAFSTDAILDTGGPTTSIHEHGDRLKIPDALLNSPHRTATQIRSGARFRVNAEGIDPGDDFELDLITGRVLAVNQVNVMRKDSDAFVNLGLIPFLRYDVVFDVERGLVGFAPCSAHGAPPKPAGRRGHP